MRTFISEKEAKEMICSIGAKMYQRQFVSANDGNMTIRIGEREVIATPTGVSKGDLTPDKLLKVDFDGNILEGTWKPTSELPMHLRIYKENDSVMSTAHAHPCYLNVFANMGMELDLSLTPATAAISGRIPVAPYRNPGSRELADSVAPYVKDYKVVLLANHGPIAWGTTPIEAWYTLEDAEAYAKMALLHKFVVGTYRPITKEQIRILAETHDMVINPKRLVNAPETTTNGEPAISLDGYDASALRLSDETIEKLAEKLAEKMKG
ncbi:MAG: class II aldolase/adducin family protein [Lachnospiraceae bacterium]|nr:class II aldolase/adducin family protein [Lachnospiraceae bacterium]